MKIENLTIGDVCKFIGGSQPPKRNFSSIELDGYVRLIQIRDYKTDLFQTYIPKTSTKKFCGPEDIMIGRYGPPIFQILRGLSGAYNVALIKAIPNKKITNNYLYYYLIQKHIFEYVEGLSPRTGGQTGVDLEMLKKYPIGLPDIPIQELLIKPLSLIDKKIKLNNEKNRILEAMAKLIYDYWFIQFDFPDENGKPYRSSGGKMVYSKELKREIPFGWSSGRLGDFEQKIITGKTPSTKNKNNFDGDIPFICIGDVRGNMYITKTEITLSEVGAASQANKFIPKDSICVTCIASPGLVGFATSESQTNQQLNTIVCSKKENRYFLYFYLKEYFKFFKAKTGNTFANMNKDDFSSILLPYPKDEIVDSFSKKVKSMFDLVLQNSNENDLLKEQRDWLLPMLMNGKVKVNKAKK